jgi:hypothetical protein
MTGKNERNNGNLRQTYHRLFGSGTGYFGGSVKRVCDRLLKTLGTDYLEVFQLLLPIQPHDGAVCLSVQKIGAALS